MNEDAKTGIFALVAGVVVLGAWLIAPRAIDYRKGPNNDLVGENLFKYEPLDAANLKILKYDEAMGQVSDFEVAKDKASNVWTIPSRYGYPADAATQMSSAANAFINLKVLDVVTDSPDQHDMYGVVEPNVEKLEVGDKGVGTLVRIQDAKGENLVNLVIGKTEKDNPKHRFVRIPSQDRVYIVELDTNPLATDFSKWIESDLLKLSSTDVQTLGIRDYTILPGEGGSQRLSPNFDADVSYSNVDGKWTADRLVVHSGAESTPRELADNEQLNATKLNDMKNALDSLRIVDVIRKPKGLAADLKVENTLLDDRQSIMTMFKRGFLPQKSSDGGSEIFATNGELLATLKDGVQYLIRFGNTTGESSEAAEGEAKDESKPDDSLKLDRFMLVTARLDESKYPSPLLTPVPETYEDLLRMEAASKAAAESISVPTLNQLLDVPGTEAPNAEAPTAEIPAGESPSAEVPEVKDPDQPAANEASGGGASDPASGGSGQARRLTSDGERLVSYQPPAEESTDPPAPEASPAEAPQQEPASPATTQPPVEGAPAEGAPVEQGAPAAQNPSAAQEPPLSEEEKKEKLEAARERVTKENQRKIDERTEKMDAARKKVAELNARFADWFYVISESEYKKLRIKLEDLIQPKSAASAGSPPGAPNFSIPPQ